MDPRLAAIGFAFIGVPAIVIGYVAAVEIGLRAVPMWWASRVRPLLWSAPSAVFLIVFLIVPTVNTIILSLQDRASRAFVGLANYTFIASDPGSIDALRNSALWLVVFTGLSVAFGLAFAVLFDRVRYESFAKAIVFIPLAISFTAAAVIWRFMYDFRPAGTTQTGTLNALLGVVGVEPVPWLVDSPLNTLALIVVGVWMWTGFNMVILSAGLKGINPELLEAARVDGA